MAAPAIDDLPCACLRTTPDRRILFVNDYFLTRYDWTRETLVGTEITHILTPASRVFCDSYVYPKAMTEPVCAEVQLTVMTGGHDRRSVVANVRQLEDGGFAWVLIEAENRKTLFTELEQARSALVEQRELLEKRSITDALTDVLNRRGFEDAVRRALAKADRDRAPITLLLMDIDHFKALNDSRGHQCGDQALATLGAILRDVTRDADLVGRFGGDEFVCALPQTDGDGAEALCTRIHNAVAERSVAVGGFSVSIGAACRPSGDGRDWDELLSVVDGALYDAKAAGRSTTAFRA